MTPGPRNRRDATGQQPGWPGASARTRCWAPHFPNHRHQDRAETANHPARHRQMLSSSGRSRDFTSLVSLVLLPHTVAHNPPGVVEMTCLPSPCPSCCGRITAVGAVGYPLESSRRSGSGRANISLPRSRRGQAPDQPAVFKSRNIPPCIFGGFCGGGLQGRPCFGISPVHRY